jgi:predicted Rossmann fold nucleotide-binding protein DprA/Smf involved in DNA uptake
VFGFISRLFGGQETVQDKPQPRNTDEKVDVIFELVKEVRDELKPIGPTGERMSRLEFIMGAMSKLDATEREALKQELESLEIDDRILAVTETPKTIEEVAEKIDRSYGYTANRLRELLKQGKAMRKRDAVTRKYVYVRV